MKYLTTLVLFCAVLFSCSKVENESVYLDADAEISEEARNAILLESSPIKSFLGTWTLESRVKDGVMDDPTPHSVIFMEEDSDYTDYSAEGYWEWSSRDDMTVIVQHQVKYIGFYIDNVSIICQYEFTDENTFVMTEEWDDGSLIVTTWMKTK